MDCKEPKTFESSSRFMSKRATDELDLDCGLKFNSKEAIGSLSSAEVFDIAFISTLHEKESKLLLNVDLFNNAL